MSTVYQNSAVGLIIGGASKLYGKDNAFFPAVGVVNFINSFLGDRYLYRVVFEKPPIWDDTMEIYTKKGYRVIFLDFSKQQNQIKFLAGLAGVVQLIIGNSFVAKHDVEFACLPSCLSLICECLFGSQKEVVLVENYGNTSETIWLDNQFC